jgi:hypothetical protein
VRTNRLQNQSRRACPELVERGRLNLAQEAVLGRDSRDEKSRRDDCGKCAASGRDEGVLPIPKTSLKKEVKIHESVSAIIAEVGAVLWVGNVVVHLQRVVVVGDVSDG